MRSRLIVVCSFLLSAVAAFAQSDRGTITGTVSDPGGAVVANAPIQARNIETGALYDAATSATGNYTIAQLPPGTYELSVSLPGFKKSTRTGLDIQVAQVVRIDVTLEVGANTESITVNEAAPMLKTETGDLSHNVTTDYLDSIPLYPGGTFRSPYNVVQLLPGVYQSVQELRISGAPNNTQSVRVEGQEASNADSPATPGQSQMSVDSIQEVTVQTSNYAPEYGQAGGGVLNFTMKSGTNQFHGSGYDYVANEVFNAGQPFNTGDPTGNPRPRLRRHDYGFTIGGPVAIPKIYDGHNRTFFFFNFEQSRQTQSFNTVINTVPTAAYRAGDFSSAILPNARVIGTDPLGRTMLEGQIYDPNTTRTDAASGKIFRDLFPGNKIPIARFDSMAAKIQNLIPPPIGPNASGLLNNYQPSFSGTQSDTSWAYKIDQSIGPKGKAAFFYSHRNLKNPISIGNGQADGLPDPLGTYVASLIPAYTLRLNYDYTLTPTTLLHFGAGYFAVHFSVPSVTTKGDLVNYNAAQELGLKGAIVNRFFPAISGLLSSNAGGMKNFGSSSGSLRNDERPTFNTSITMVRGNHTYKIGGELKIEGLPVENQSGTTGSYGFSPSQTGEPFQQTAVGGANVGFGYASYLLGLVNNVSISYPTYPKIGKNQTGLYVQDSWKVTRKLTVDYGVRYDYSTYLKEQYGRAPFFSPAVLNPTVGNLPGGAIFEGSGPGHCNCNLAHNYPWAFGPRLGFAYQITPKTVARGGFGIVYNGTEQGDGYTSTFAGSTSAVSATFGNSLSQFADGYPTQYYPPAWPNFNPGQFPSSLTPGAQTVGVLDQNAGRPARQYQWSFGLQRELWKDLVVEAEYVGNRGIWWISNGQILPNALTPQRLAAFGIDATKPADQTLLTSSLNSAVAIQRGIKAPYAGFPTSGVTVAQALRPFPQFTDIRVAFSPIGNTWYDSLQSKLTKRLSHGLAVVGTLSWSKTLTIGVEREPNPGTTGNASYSDVFNRVNQKTLSLYDSPWQSTFSATYTTPSAWKGNKIVSAATRGWTYAAVLGYRSGLPMPAPAATQTPNLSNLLFQTTFANRVPGQPLYTVDLNCHCYDPQKVYALNPNAWAQPTPGTFGGGAAYYDDYRKQRRPSESMSFGRTFRFTEKANFNIRMDLNNVFNRAVFNDPRNNDLLEVKSKLPNGNTNPNSGFGAINATQTVTGAGFAAVVNLNPRNGVIVGRFVF